MVIHSYNQAKSVHSFFIRSFLVFKKYLSMNVVRKNQDDDED